MTPVVVSSSDQCLPFGPARSESISPCSFSSVTNYAAVSLVMA